jgi:hypothetical protein
MTSKSLRPPMRGILVPALVGFALAIVATIIAGRVVAPAIAAKGGAFSRWDRGFVGMCGAAAFFLGFFVSKRLIRGERHEQRSWMLSVEQVVPSATSYREAAAPSVADLVERLGARGYKLQTRRVDEANAPVAGGDDRDPLAGAAVELSDERARARIVVRVSERAAGEGGGLGIVTAIEQGGKLASEELALFAIVELAGMLPGLKYKDADSALPPDDIEMLRASLPDKPRALS